MRCEIISTIILCVALSSCNCFKRQKAKTYITSPKLKQALDIYIKEYSNENTRKIYVSYFYKIGNGLYVDIFQSSDYETKYIDACFFKDKELVITYFLDRVNGMSIKERKCFLADCYI